MSVQAKPGDPGSDSEEAGSAPDLSSPPSGFRLSRSGEGGIVVNAPAAQDRLVVAILAPFSLMTLVMGLGLLSDKPAAGLAALSAGALLSWPAAYFLFGRVEIVLGPDSAEWRRVFLKPWSVKSIRRENIVSIGSAVRIRTNGRPTSWGLHFTTRDRKPLPEWLRERFPPTNRSFLDRSRRRNLAGSWNESGVLWLGHVLRRWAGKPFESALDRSVIASDRDVYD